MKRYEYEITALPTLPPLGEEPPVTLAELRALVDHHARVRRVLEGILLVHDVELLVAVRQGQKTEERPFILTRSQLSEEEPLPEFLTVQEDGASGDRVWQSYFHHVTSLGLSSDAHILPAWAGFEVTLRNALAERRGRLAGHTLPPPIVAEELSGPLTALAKEVDAWAAAKDPLSAHRVLSAVRREWIEEHRSWYSFGIDEIAAYGMEWLLLQEEHACRNFSEEVSSND